MQIQDTSELQQLATKRPLTDAELFQGLANYRGHHPALIAIAYGYRLGLGQSDQSDAEHFEAAVASWGPERAEKLRTAARELATQIQELGVPGMLAILATEKGGRS